jgi:hypothetical protein
MMAFEAALEGFRLDAATSAQLIAEMAANEDNELLREAERQVRALRATWPKPSACGAARASRQGTRQPRGP